MAFQYNYQLETQFPNKKADLGKLEEQIKNSSIKTAVDYLTSSLGFVSIFFKAELSDTDENVLEHLIENHDGIPNKTAPTIVKSEQLTEHIRFVESGDTTQGMYAAQSLIIDVSTGEAEKVTYFSWPYDIALMSGTLGVAENMVGDNFSVDVGPNTLIGILTAPLNVGDTSINVSSTVFENLKRGYYFGLYIPGNLGVELGQVLDLNEEKGYITLVDPVDVSSIAGFPVAMCAKIIPNLYLHDMSKVEIGKQIPTGQRIPANLPIKVTYKNNNLVAKKISFFVEYLY